MARYGSKLKKKSKKSDTRSRWHKAHVAPPPLLPPSATHTLASRSSIPETLRSIERLSVKELPLVIQQAAQLENVAFQHKVIDLCLRRIILQTSLLVKDFEPRYKQIYTLRRLIFRKGNTLLITYTGFGKSLIFHIYTVLTGKITI